MVKIRVPATSANLGAGFDCMGVAVALYNYVYMDFSDRLEIVSLDGFKVPTGKANLIYKSAVFLFEACGFKNLKGLKIEQKNNIFQTRGLGSSSACIVAGLMGANALLGFPVKKRDILNMATKLEGHPDNVAPAIFGDMVVCAVGNGKVCYVKNRVSSKLKFVFFVPNFKMDTNKARQILKKEVSLKDAVFNISRAGLFISSIINGRFLNLKLAVQDRLHQSSRLNVIENGINIFRIAYKFGAYGVYLSGAGPSIVAICDRYNRYFERNVCFKLKELGIKGWSVFNFRVDRQGVVAETF